MGKQIEPKDASDVKVHSIVRVTCPMQACVELKPGDVFERRFDLDLDHEDAEEVRYGGTCPNCDRTVYVVMVKTPGGQ